MTELTTVLTALAARHSARAARAAADAILVSHPCPSDHEYDLALVGGDYTDLAWSVDVGMAADPDAAARYEEIYGVPWRPLADESGISFDRGRAARSVARTIV